MVLAYIKDYNKNPILNVENISEIFEYTQVV